MDYDETNIPAGYDRGRDHGPEFLDLWMNVIQSHVGRGPVRTILDLGCGTGRFSAGLANRFRARVVGLDPSEKMLAQARRKPGQDAVFYQRGAAEALYRRIWGKAALAGRRPFYVAAGNVTRLQVGPFASRAAGESACRSLGIACFPVAAK